MSADDRIMITAVDFVNGDTGTRTIAPGDYCLIAAEPLYLAGEQRHPNGTVVLTLKRRVLHPTAAAPAGAAVEPLSQPPTTAPGEGDATVPP